MEGTKRCPYCGEEILAVAIKCKHCASMLDGSVPAAAPAVPRIPIQELVEIIPGRLEKKLVSLLGQDEEVCLKLRGTFKEALVCTDRRVLILKTGYMTGHFFGANVFQSPYRNITSAQVNTHLLTGYFELSAGGVRNVPTSYWSQGKNGAAQRDNCVSLVRRLFPKFEHAAGFIMSNCGH